MRNLEELVQNVLDGIEDPEKAKGVLFDELVRVNKCLDRIDKYVKNEVANEKKV